MTKKFENTKSNNLSAEQLVNQKEHEYMFTMMDCSLKQLCFSAGIKTDKTKIDDMSRIADILHTRFLFQLFKDNDFLNLKVIGHFSTEEGYEVFGLTLKDVYECRSCDCEITEWYAFIINNEDGNYGLAWGKCSEHDAVKNSPFKGKNLRKVLKHYEFLK
uniref:hypothetical protein n=1 Tax=Acetatifactor sp. TaxID=1872090 RepID=UPI004056479A